MTSINTKASGVVSVGGAGVVTLYVAEIHQISSVELTLIEFEGDEVCLILIVSQEETVQTDVVYDQPFILYSQAQVILIEASVFIQDTVILLDIYCVLSSASSTSVNEKLSGVVSGSIVVITYVSVVHQILSVAVSEDPGLELEVIVIVTESPLFTTHEVSVNGVVPSLISSTSVILAQSLPSEAFESVI